MAELRTTLTVRERSISPAPSAKRSARQSVQVKQHRRLACVSPGAGFDLQSGRTLDPDSRWDPAGKPKLAADQEQRSSYWTGSVVFVLCLAALRWAPNTEHRRDAYDTIGSRHACDLGPSRV